MKQSNASLKERLAGWQSIDKVSYDVGACLGFWRDFGAPMGEDPWNGAKAVIWSNSALGIAIYSFIAGMLEEGMLEYENNDDEIPNLRWNASYKGLI